MTNQLTFDFLEDLDKQIKDEKEYQAYIWNLKHARYMLKSMLERYPPRAEEWEIMLMGIRLARFVSDLECAECSFDTTSHCPGIFDYMIDEYGHLVVPKVCIRDYFGKCVEWEILPVEYPEVHDQINASIERNKRRLNKPERR